MAEINTIERKIKQKCGKCGYRMFDMWVVNDEIHLVCHKCSNLSMRLGRGQNALEELKTFEEEQSKIKQLEDNKERDIKIIEQSLEVKEVPEDEHKDKTSN